MNSTGKVDDRKLAQNERYPPLLLSIYSWTSTKRSLLPVFMRIPRSMYYGVRFCQLILFNQGVLLVPGHTC
jgi:hypothetical protein